MSEPTGDMTAAFSAALETASTPVAETSPVSTPVVETPAETVAPAAITQAAAETPAPVSVSADTDPSSEKPKEPPAWRWQDILENTRKSVREETAAQVRQEIEAQYADFRDTTPEERAGLKIWNQALKGDPQALAMVAQVNPALAQAISGKAPESKPETEPEPDAAIQLPDGSTVPTFTPQGLRAWQAWSQRQMESSLAEKFKPLTQIAERERVQQEVAARQQQTQTWAAQVLSPLKRLPYFEEFKPEIGKALAAVPKDFSGNLEEVVFDAYTKLHLAKLDALTKDGEAKALASIQTRAVAATGNPATPSVSTPKKRQPTADGFAETLRELADAS